MECPACGVKAQETARFCASCGAVLTAVPPLRTPSSVPPAGETRLLTVLFTDLSGSVAATHDLDPEAAADRVNEVLDLMAGAIVRYEGRIDRYLGDGVLAFFGTPHAHEDDPIRAVSAALEIREGVERLGLQATSGINTGEVYLGRIGSDRHAEFSALGPVINLAARLQSKAMPGQVLVGESTYRTARGSFQFRPLTLDIKGIPRPVRAHLAVRRLARPRKARGIEGVRAEMVGRSGELGRLLAAVDAVRRGSGKVVTVVGEAGIGKSRLIAEMNRRLELEGSSEGEAVLWLEGRCLETTTGTSYAPFVDLLQDFFGDGDGPSAVAGKVPQILDELVRRGELSADRASDTGHLLNRLLGRSTDGEDPFREAPPEQIRNQTFQAIQEFLVALSRRHPVVVFLDDLHWADDLSFELATLLMGTTGRAPLLLLLASRPGTGEPARDLESAGSRRAGARLEIIRLAPLDEAESARLLTGLVPLPDWRADLRETVLGRAQGNPLFLEEMLRSLVEQGVLVRQGEDWQLTGARAGTRVPDSLQGIMLSRVDRLDAASKQVLQAAAVIGRVFGRRLLEAVLEPMTRDELARVLAGLEGHDLVYLDRLVPEEEYSFKHVLTRDTVYGSLLRRHRADLHASAARAIEALYPDRLEEHYEQLARHYDQADDAGKALEYLWRAGDKARRSFLNPAARSFYLRALERLPAAQPADEAGDERAARLQECLGDVCELAGRREEALTAYDAALASTRISDPIGRARILRKKGASLQIQFKTEESRGCFETALETLGLPRQEWERERWHERIEIALAWMMLVYFTGSTEELTAVLARHREEIELHGSHIQRGSVRRILALAGLRRERYIASDETVEHARSSLEVIEESASLPEIGFARFNYGFTLLWRGRLAEADRIMGSALAVAERLGDATLQCRCTAYLALIARKRQDTGDARSFADRTLILAEAGDLKEYMAAGHAHRAWAAAREQAWDEAEREGREAEQLWEALGGPYLLFAWMPAWPLLMSAVARADWAEAGRQVRILLAPERQPMPVELADALEAAASAEDGAEAEARFAEVQRLARPLGYL